MLCQKHAPDLAWTQPATRTDAMAVPQRALDRHPAVRFGGDVSDYGDILTPAAITFVADLHRRFDSRRLGLLAERSARQQRYDAGELPDFRADTADIREGNWTV